MFYVSLLPFSESSLSDESLLPEDEDPVFIFVAFVVSRGFSTATKHTNNIHLLLDGQLSVLEDIQPVWREKNGKEVEIGKHGKYKHDIHNHDIKAKVWGWKLIVMIKFKASVFGVSSARCFLSFQSNAWDAHFASTSAARLRKTHWKSWNYSECCWNDINMTLHRLFLHLFQQRTVHASLQDGEPPELKCCIAADMLPMSASRVLCGCFNLF